MPDKASEKLKFDAYVKERIGTEWLSDERQRDRLTILKRFLSNSKSFVLDCGCGEVEPLIICNSQNAVAFDIAMSGLKNLKFRGFRGYIVLGSCVLLPFVDKCFEKSVCSEVIEHLPTDSDVRKCIVELKRVSKSFLLTTPNNNKYFRWLERTHRRFFDTKNIKRVLPQNAFVTTSRVSHKYVNSFPVLPYFILDKYYTNMGRYLLWLDLRLRKTIIGYLVKKIISLLSGGAFVVALSTANENYTRLPLN